MQQYEEFRMQCALKSTRANLTRGEYVFGLLRAKITRGENFPVYSKRIVLFQSHSGLALRRRLRFSRLFCLTSFISERLVL